MTTKATASRMLIAPRGSSRFAVRGLSASMRASASRLNPIAALRAATIAARIHSSGPTPSTVSEYDASDSCLRCAASSAPANANGSANTEWLTRTNEAYTARRFSMADCRVSECRMQSAECKMDCRVLIGVDLRFNRQSSCNPKSAISQFVHPAYLTRFDPADQVFFDIDGGGRNRDGQQPCRLAGLDGAVVGIES